MCVCECVFVRLYMFVCICSCVYVGAQTIYFNRIQIPMLRLYHNTI